jgi:hypothetical protein
MNHDDIREWLRSLESGERKVVKSEVAKWDNASRKIRSGGRPKILRPCPACGTSYGVREMAKHDCPSAAR